MLKYFKLLIFVVFSFLAALAAPQGHGTLVRAATLHVSPGMTAER